MSALDLSCEAVRYDGLTVCHAAAILIPRDQRTAPTGL